MTKKKLTKKQLQIKRSENKPHKLTREDLQVLKNVPQKSRRKRAA